MPFTSCISRRNSTQVDDAQYIDAVMYNLIEYSGNYLNKSGILWQFYSDVLALDHNCTITNFIEANATTESFNLKEKLTGKTGDIGTKNVEIMVPLKYLSNFWRTFEMPLIN